MARPKNESPRVLGPYPKSGGYQIVHVKRDGEREHFAFKTKEAADAALAALVENLHRPAKTIREALTDYETFMRDEKGNKENSIDQTGRKLRRFFDDLDVALADLTPERVEALYLSLRTSKRRPQRPGAASAPDAKPVSVDYHRNALSEAKTFLRWCAKKKWIASNPLDGVEGVGKRNHGKEQLRIDEARKWIAKAVELADREDEEGAVAAMTTLLLGIRCSEVVSRVVRDLDDEGRLLWIPESKTAKGRRTLEVPPVLRPFLLELAEGKKPDELLFGYHDRAWPRTWVQRICRKAGIPVVTAHGQRGLHGTLSIAAGITPRAVADALGHESFATTARSYARPEAVGQAAHRRTLKVLEGGRAKEPATREVAG
ncbi:MAG: tyrosine-type recombinase/integrase [Myxococcales bacterium]|nr:tyrosine-type recombinase/integrase [Myxococcales bacterium]